MVEWCTIESDPGVFTELIKNIGVKGVQVEEILDMDTLESSNETVYGLIFLFKYMKNSGYTPNVLQYWDTDLFFAKQIIENACATQAILGVLMNNSEKLDIGPTLKELKSFTVGMDPTMCGMTISNCEKIKIEHNKFARPEPFEYTKEVAEDGDDVFHFVSYIHFKNAIYEIDGLQEGPILIEKNVTYEEWIKKVKPFLISRINLYSNNEIKFNLLAIVPDRLDKAQKEKDLLLVQKNYIQGLINGENVVKNDKNYDEFNNMNKEQLNLQLENINLQIKVKDETIKEENFKIQKYKEENERRQHNYIPLIFELLNIMGEKGILQQAYNEAVEEENRNVLEEKKNQENKK